MAASIARAYTPKPAPNPEAPPPSGPHFLNLRYDEDYSFLAEDPAARETSPLLRLKYIPLGRGWHIDFGGEFRLRMENRANQTFGLDPRTADTQQNYRWMLHANVTHGERFRLFVQGIFAHVEDQDGPFEPTQENHGDLHQLFADVKLVDDMPLTLRLGRQEFSYGNDRLVGPLDWVSTRRRFDAVKLMYEGERFNLDAFAAHPVVVERTTLDGWNEDYGFYGLYGTYKGIRNHGIDAYLFISDNNAPTRNPNRRTGDKHIYTVGTRFWGYAGGFDYDAELAGQWGSWAGDTVQAWLFEVDGGYTFQIPWRPRLGAGFGYASGDDDPFDRSVATFDQLFPYNDVCIGIADLIGRQNLTRAYVNVDVWPVPDKLMVATYFHSYWLSEGADAYYNVGGIPVLRDLSGGSGVELGRELDIWVECFLAPHASVALGYAHFWEGNYVHRRVGTATEDDDPNLLLLQFRYRF